MAERHLTLFGILADQVPCRLDRLGPGRVDIRKVTSFLVANDHAVVEMEKVARHPPLLAQVA
jgi:hypothetical protein